MNLLFLIIMFSLVGGILSTIGGIFLILREQFVKKFSIHLVSFAAGALLATAFFELLPEATSAVLNAKGSTEKVFLFTFLGLLFFFVVEGILFRLHHHHGEDPCAVEQAQTTTRTPILVTFGDSLHNFIDGIAIAAAFLVNIPLGIATTFAVVSHEIPQEIGDFSIMLHAGWEKKKVLLWNLFSSLMSTAGALITYALKEQIESTVGYLLAFAAGLFIYIATADLMPELYHCSRRDGIVRTIIIFLFGSLVIFLFSAFLGV